MKVKDLKEYKNNLYNSLSGELAQFEKNFLYISGGILAFSITFISQIVKIDQAINLAFLFIAWGFFIASIALMMMTFLKSASYSNKLLIETDNFIVENSLYNEDSNLKTNQIEQLKMSLNSLVFKSKKTLKFLRNLSVFTFIVGLVFFAFFVSTNIINEKNIKSKTTCHEGIYEN